MRIACSLFLGLASVLAVAQVDKEPACGLQELREHDADADSRSATSADSVDDVLPEPFLKTPNAFTRDNDNVRDRSFLSQQGEKGHMSACCEDHDDVEINMPPESEQAENYGLRQAKEEAAFYVGGSGHLVEVMNRGTREAPRYRVTRTWVLPKYLTLPGDGDSNIQWMTRFRTVDGRKRVAVFAAAPNGKGRSMLVIDPLAQGEDGKELNIEKVLSLDPAGDRNDGTHLNNPVGARASKANDYQKLYVAMFQDAAGVVTVENYSVKDKGGSAKVQQYRLSAFLQQLDDSAKKLHHLHNAHTFPADMCGGSGGTEVTLVDDLGEIWNTNVEETRGYGVLQFVEEGFQCTGGAGGDQMCYFRNATQLGGVPKTSTLMANQMHARQTARDLTAREMLFVAEQPVRAGLRDISSRLHWVEVQKAQQNGFCSLIVRQTVELPRREVGPKDYGYGAADPADLPSSRFFVPADLPSTLALSFEPWFVLE
eukprot:g17697.t1